MATAPIFGIQINEPSWRSPAGLGSSLRVTGYSGATGRLNWTIFVRSAENWYMKGYEYAEG